MSNTVDSRVVEMSFDNQNFESNVQTSLGTLDKLKQALKLDKAGDGLQNIASSVKNVNFGPLGDAVETVKSKFSALEIMGITALTNITNSAVNAGKQMLNSLTVAPVKEGFEEYELKMGSVQTIMAGTGESLETVMGYLNDLNTYSDKTIYSFADMTNNIGKFTNAGVKLDSAVSAIQGVANVAALSGANSQEASRAMYNFAQALSAGYVKLIDWKSIENANMATVEFKTQLLESAVAAGKLEKTADGMYKVLTTNASGSTMKEAISATSNFNDSLAYQWMTTDVLTKTLSDYADETTDIGKRAFAAAQDVKTFSQLMDTLKEAVGSGWAESFEIIFGNFEEAKKLWTGVSNTIGDIIGQQADARNKILKTWKTLGGRDSIINTVANLFTAVSNSLKLVKQSFMIAFGSLSGEQLYSVSKALEDLSVKIKDFLTNADTMRVIVNVFTGFFHALHIGVTAIKAIVSGVAQLASAIISKLSPSGSSVLELSKKFTTFFSKLDLYVTKTGIFQEYVNKFVDFLLALPSKIDSVFKDLTGTSLTDVFDKVKESVGGAFDKIKEVFSGLGDIDFKGLDGFTERVEGRFGTIKKVFGLFKTIFEGIAGFFKKIAPVFSAVFALVGDILLRAGNAIKEALSNFTFSDGIDLLNSGALIAIAMVIKKFFTGLKEVIDGKSDIGDKIKGILDSVTESFSALQENLKSKSLKNIAISIGIIAASLLVLSLIDSDKLAISLGALAAAFGELMGAFKILSKIDPGSSAKSSASLIAMSFAVILLAGACLMLSQLDWNQLATGLSGVAVLMGLCTATAKILSSEGSRMTKGLVGLIAFAAAINILVIAVKSMSEMDPMKLAQGLIAVGALIGEIGVFLKMSKMESSSISAGLGILILASAIIVLAKAVDTFGQMDSNALFQGLVGVGAVLAELSAFVNTTGNAKKTISTATSMVILGAAMLVLQEAVDRFGQMDPGALAQGLFAMASALAAIALAFNFMPKNTVGIAVGLTIAGAALLIISQAMKSFGSISYEQIAQGLVAMVGALGALAMGLNLMKGTLGGSAALLIAAAAMAILCPVFKAFGSMEWEQIAKALAMLAGGLIIIGGAGLILSAAVVPILAFAAAVTLIGVGVLAASAGLLLFSTAIVAVCGAGTAGIVLFVQAIKAVISLIPEFAGALARGFIEILKVIGDSAEQICKTAVQIGTAVLEALIELIPKILDFVTQMLAALTTKLPEIVSFLLQLFDQLLSSLDQVVDKIVRFVLDLITHIITAIGEKIPDLIQAGINMLSALLDGLVQTAGMVTEFLFDFIISIMDALGEKIPEFAQAGIDMIIAILDGLSDGMVENAERLRESIINFCQAVIDAIKAFFGINSPSTEMADIGMNLVLGLIQGIGDFLGDLLAKIGEVCASVISAVGEWVSSFWDKGCEFVSNLASGIWDGITNVTDTVSDVVSGAIDTVGGFVDSFVTKGGELMTSLKTGISNKLSTVKAAAVSVVNGAKNALSNMWSHFKDIGSNLISGLKNGIVDAAQNVIDAVKGVATSAIDGAKALLGIQSPSRVFAEIGRFVDEGFAKGMLNNVSKVISSTKEVGNAAIETISDSISNISDAMDLDVDYEPVIRPVIDLTDVTNGVRSIDNMLYSQRAMQLASSIDLTNTSSNDVVNNATKVMTDKLAKEFESLKGEINELSNAIFNIKLVMDTGATVGALVNGMDRALGTKAVMVGRSV